MARIYLDNAATSWPKPDCVYEAVDRYQRKCGAPAGRGSYSEAVEVERTIADTRRLIAGQLGADEPQRVVFTANGTAALNLALHGWLRAGDHVVTTTLEHNSVVRPLRILERERGVRITWISCGENGYIDPSDVRRAIVPTTRLVAVTHVSNVTGAVQPIAAVGAIAQDAGVPFLVDAAQSLGHLPFDNRIVRASLIAAPGHKGLLGPLGTGFLYIGPGMESQLSPLHQGGTGTQSESELQPDELPEKYESGNLNVPGLFGLAAALRFVHDKGVEILSQHEQSLTQRLCAGLVEIPGVRVIGPAFGEPRSGVVSVTVDGYDPQDVSAILDTSFTIQARSGLHCASMAHATMRTLKRGGTVRFSVGPFSTLAEIDATIFAVQQLVGGP